MTIEPIILVILTGLITGLIGFLFGMWRDKSNHIFNKKLKIYSDIVYEINTYKFLSHSLKKTFEIQESNLLKFKKQSDEIKNEDRSVQNNDSLRILEESMKDLRASFTICNSSDSLIKLLAPARLIGTNQINKEIREYYSLAVDLLQAIEKKEDTYNKMSECVMRLEQLMRADLVGFWNRDLSDFVIKKHLEKHSR